MRAVLCALLTGFLLAGCKTTSPGVAESDLARLSGSELQEVLPGNTLYREGGDLLRSWEYAGFYRPDGTMLARVWWSSGEERAEGSWEVSEDGLYCRTWSNDWGGGERGCFRVSRNDQLMVFDHVSGSRGDAERYVYSLLPGNPYGL